MKTRLLVLGLCVNLFLGFARDSMAITWIPTQATWRYQKGTNPPSAPADAWRLLAFDDTRWASGPAPFFYGEDLAGGTQLNDMRNRYSSVFLRRGFAVDRLVTERKLSLRALCDDGFIAWINGVEVARYNVPGGEPAVDGFASTAVSEPVAFALYALPAPTFLVTGSNVLAVQVFNNSLTSSDLQWDAELLGEEPDFQRPQIARISPSPGTYENLTEITITFSEPVTGVNPSDLYLGPNAAQSVAGADTTYVFRFAQLHAGLAQLRWDADTVISDLASPANRFDPVAAGIASYTVVDHSPPKITALFPRAATTVRSLSQIEVQFSEPVAGVDASDLLVNGVPAFAVASSQAGVYRFEFPAAGPGWVEFSWVAGHGIQDEAQPPNAFAGGSWSLEVDPDFTIPEVRLNELLAANISSGGLKDEDGELQDWIELYNQSTNEVDLAGWSLTDDPQDPDRWIFPELKLAPGQLLVVFASGKDRRPTSTGMRLHTNFKLNVTGEYLALLSPDAPRAAVSEFAPQFPEQRNDYSYGYDQQGDLRYFRQPTPGAPNGTSTIEGVVPPPHLNAPHGWYDQPFDLIITSALPGTTVRYTLDGSEPTASHGLDYQGPLKIKGSTILRVAGFKANLLPSTVCTRTYLFAQDVLRQSNQPAGFPVGPTVMAGFPSDYEMDPEIMTNELYRGMMKDSILALPAVSIVCQVDDMFGSASGIYTHPTSRGPAWERPCSIELLPCSGESGFQINAGIQIQGNANREPQKQPKHAFRVVFKGDYGPTHLQYPVFPDSPVTEFDTLVLRADFNFSWLHWNSAQRVQAQRTRDAWMKDSMRAMGGLATHNRYVHLFINGLYWGVYDPSERPDAAFAASYLGKTKLDYDVMNEGAAVDGNSDTYRSMVGLSNLADPTAYARMRQYLDLTQYIDYILLHFYVGHQDWGMDKNWYAIRPKDSHLGFLYLPWDGEMILSGLNDNRVSDSDTASGLHTKLTANAEYRLMFADRARKHLFFKGSLTPSKLIERWLKRAREIETAIVAESARWGDYRRDVHSFSSGPYELYTRDNQWKTEQNRLLNQYFPNRTAIVLEQLRAAGLYPDVPAPDFNQAGGTVLAGFSLSMAATKGAIYFTLDGSDPRAAISSTVAASAIMYRAPLVLTNGVRINARALSQGVWSALSQAEFEIAGQEPALRLTEIMYHPSGGDTFEFVELKNTSGLSLDVSGCWFEGIDFVFPHGVVIGPGKIVVLASAISPSAFSQRYPGVTVSGYFSGSLANGGERIALHARDGQLITDLTYADGGAWPKAADGDGYSLEVRDPLDNPNDPANWLASTAILGSPGNWQPSEPPPSAVRLSELQVTQNTDATIEAAGDWIELANNSDAPEPVGGWLLTDYGSHDYIIPTGTLVPAHGFLVIQCDKQTNGPGLHAPFQLATEGETVGLYHSSGKRVDAVTFGALVPAYSLGRIGGNDRWELCTPTSGSSNVRAELASVAGLKINEWLAAAPPGADDWIELYNPDSSAPVDLRGLKLVTEKYQHRFWLASFIPPGGFGRFRADNHIESGHVELRLPADGGSLTLQGADGAAIDQITYPEQPEGVSQGRWPDGSPTIVAFPGTASPGRPNVLIGQAGIVLNEFMVTTNQKLGWIELHNPTSETIVLAGFQLSLESDGGRSWTLPAAARIDAGGFLLINFDAAHEASTNFVLPLFSGHRLDPNGGGICLRDDHNLPRDYVGYGFLVPGLSIGRSSTGWTLLATATPGVTNSAPASLAPPSSLRINEWLATATNGEDFIELYNPEPKPVLLSGLLFSDDPSLAGAARFQIGPLSFIGPASWVAFKADNSPSQGPNHLNFQLDRLGETIRLRDHVGALIDAIDFGTQTSGQSEGRLTDGGTAIGLLVPAPTPGRSNLTPPIDLDSDGDGLPDAWEMAEGTDPSNPDAQDDPDRDGLNNLEEYQCGTHPTDPNSCLKFERFSRELGLLTIQFIAEENHSYSILSRSSLEADSWKVLSNITPLPTRRIETTTLLTGSDQAKFFLLVSPAVVPP
jgi:hypothetical protein